MERIPNTFIKFNITYMHIDMDGTYITKTINESTNQ